MYVAIDIGGTNARIAIASSLSAGPEGRPVFQRIERIKMQNNFEDDIQAIETVLQEILAGEQAEFIGVGLPGVVEKHSVGLRWPGNLTDWHDKDIKSRLNKYSVITKLLNDAACAALGEFNYGGWDVDQIVFVVWGTGIGGCEVRLEAGKQILLPFEPGYQLIPYQGELRRWEKVVGGVGLADIYKKEPSELTEQEWEEVMPIFAQGLYNITLVRYTRKIILGGGVAINNPAKVELLTELLNDLDPDDYDLATVELTRLGDEAGLYGALALHLL